MDYLIGEGLLALVFIILIYAKLCQMADAMRELAQRPKTPGVKTGILQTISGRVFTVKKKRKVVYADDPEAWRREQVAAGEIPDSGD